MVDERKRLSLQEKIDDRVTRTFALFGITQERMDHNRFAKWLRRWFWLVEHWFKIGYTLMFLVFIVYGVTLHLTYINLMNETHKGCEFACRDNGNYTMVGLYMNESDIVCQCGTHTPYNTVPTVTIYPSGEPAQVPIEELIKHLIPLEQAN